MQYTFIKFKFSILFCVLNTLAYAQTSILKGRVLAGNHTPVQASIIIDEGLMGTTTDSTGNFILKNINPGNHILECSAIGYREFKKTIHLKPGETHSIKIDMAPNSTDLSDVVISGTLKEVSKTESPVPVEVYTAKFFKANPTPSIFDALQNVNGVRPQLNCNICNTGDIHINGIEGPYTIVLIDGMPIVSGLSTVYGLSGIPQSLIERIEIVKGPASTLYGSEAVGGLINIITKKPITASRFAADAFASSWGEINADLSAKFDAGRKAVSLLGLNYFNYQNPVDNNNDGFTDVTLQNRISIFNKWNIERKDNRAFSIAGRLVFEDRWGGDMRWNKSYRGGDSLYGESIYTKRWELFGNYQLPLREKIILQFSVNNHDQDSRYGTTSYIAKQTIGFGQLTWDRAFKDHDILAGAAFRYTFYDDNTPATERNDSSGLAKNHASYTYLPGVFFQDEVTINNKNKILVGLRYDFNSIHGSILTPRLNYKWSSANKNNVLRIGIGNGYRVANVFTEDHAALTGSRQVVFLENLKPETSWNGNINFVKKIFIKNGPFIGLDATIFYTRFSNKIIADYDLDPNKIIYQNLKGYAISKGLSLNMDINFPTGLKILMGGTWLDVYKSENKVKTRQLFTEKFSGTWNVGYTIKKARLSIDYTGNIYSPMRLPLLSKLDPRKEYSPWWSIQNIQLTKKFNKKFELYAGIKNLLNWTPNKGNPFIIARANDPFDKNVQYNSNGQTIPTVENPYALTFDPSYVYAPNQGIRGFLGFRWGM